MSRTYKENYSDHIISIEESNLIKPADLYKHIGEILMFHNGLGYVVSGKLTDCSIDIDEYSFEPYENSIEYEDELMMDMFYHPTDAYAINDTVYSAQQIALYDVHKDDMMRNIKYIAVPTEEELSFRNKILSLNKEWYDLNYDYIRGLEIKYNEETTLYPIETLLNEEEQEKINKIFNF